MSLDELQDEYESFMAEMECERNEACDLYFLARPQIDNHDRRKVFEAGFERAWIKAKKDRNHV